MHEPIMDDGVTDHEIGNDPVGFVVVLEVSVLSGTAVFAAVH